MVSLVSNGQQLPVNHFDTENVLPHNTVRALLNTDDGVLWIGTDNGLVKKFNNTYQSFFIEEGLPLNNIWALAQDSHRDLWIGTYGKGVAHFNGRTFTNLSTAEGLINDEITHLFSTKNLMYVGTSRGISLINTKTKKVVGSASCDQIPPMRISGFYEFKNVVYATTYDTGIFKISYKNQQLGVERVSDHKFIYAAIVKGDSLYASNKKCVSVFSLADLEQKKSNPVTSASNQSINWDYTITKNNSLYAAAWGIYENNGGLVKFEKSGLECRRLTGIKSKQIISLAYNPTLDMLYAGTRDQGLLQIPLQSDVLFTPSIHSKILDIKHVKGSKVMLDTDGLDIDRRYFDRSFFKNKQLAFTTNNKVKLPKYEDFFYELDYGTPESEIVFYGIKSSATHVWINTNIGLYRFLPDGRFDGYMPVHTLEFGFGPQGQLIETNPYHGVRVYNPDASNYTYYPEELASTPTDVVSVLHTSKRTYFLSVFEGLFSYDGNFKSYKATDLWSESKLKHSTAYRNGIAVSNEAGDLFIIDENDGFKVSRKIPRVEIKGNTISSLNSYKDWLIVATEQGVTFKNEKRQLFLDKEQGITKPVYASSVINDTLHLASDNGHYTIGLKSFLNKKEWIERVTIDELRINSNPYAISNLEPLDVIRLSSSENNLNLFFSTNTHPYPDKLFYEYRLKNDADWVTVEGQQIELNYLSPDRYQLSIRVTDISTGQIYQQQLLNLKIAAPFYMQWWFIISTGLLFIGIIYFYFDRKSRRQQALRDAEIAANKRVEELKTEALLAQMNPHFIFNALNSIQYLVVMGENDKASDYLNKFAQLVRTNLNNSQRPFITLEEELTYLKTYCEIENERHNNRIEIDFEVDPTIDVKIAEIPTLILQPFLENVFVHAFPPKVPAPKLLVIINQMSDDRISYEIRDNGIGNHQPLKKSSHSSKGISMIKERLAFLGYDVPNCLSIDHTDSGSSILLHL